jgi:hypothetical protein
MPPTVTILDTELRQAGFTDETGIPRFKDTVQAYSNDLFERSINYGTAARSPNLPLEVTHEHVRQAASYISVKIPKSKWLIPTQAGEYLCIIVAGVGGGNLDKTWGILALVVGLALAVTLFALRIAKLEQK